jgi:anti-sigma28 factor (negative regulator of flagellin synthesis)
MKAVVRNQSAQNSQPQASEQHGVLPQSPEQSDSATSGTYFRAVRPTEAEAAALARGEPIIDGSPLERLRSTIKAGTWRGDSQVIAQRMIDDAIDE